MSRLIVALGIRYSRAEVRGVGGAVLEVVSEVVVGDALPSPTDVGPVDIKASHQKGDAPITTDVPCSDTVKVTDDKGVVGVRSAGRAESTTKEKQPSRSV